MNMDAGTADSHFPTCRVQPQLTEKAVCQFSSFGADYEQEAHNGFGKNNPRPAKRESLRPPCRRDLPADSGSRRAADLVHGYDPCRSQRHSDGGGQWGNGSQHDWCAGSRYAVGIFCAPGNATAAASGVVPTSYMAPVPPEMPIPAPPNALLGEGAFSTRNLTANAPEQPQLIAAAEPGPQLSPLTISMLTTPTNGQPAEQAVAGVLQYTVEHHPLLRVRQAEIEAARAKIVTARLLPNPELTVDTLDSPSESGPPEISTRLMFTLPLGPKRELRAAAAETGVCVAQLAMSRDTKVILAEAADAAIEVLYLQELLVVYGQLSGLAQQVSNIEQERFNVAAVPYRSVVLTQLAASRLELLQQDTAAQLDQAKVRLARAVGATDGSPPSIGGKLAVQPDLLRARRNDAGQGAAGGPRDGRIANRHREKPRRTFLGAMECPSRSEDWASLSKRSGQ